MSYTALYRKYRPDTFEDVKGQEHITTTLKNQIRADRIGHAYLFCGTRGTEKTTVAKVFSKAVNCLSPIEGTPCRVCEMCTSIAAGTSMNVVELDAASNNGVDSIRQIIDEVAYPPTEGRFRVYIIDEVHMLSTGAFNALLKTLEEPPAYVIFILATTEAHKIPLTILSRCQRYDFHRITVDTIAARLDELLAAEEIEAEEKAVRYVARMGDGSMRDALSLLDQCVSFYIGEKLTYEKVLDVLGAADTEVFSELLRGVMEGNAAAATDVIRRLILEGRELGQFVTDFIWYLRSLLLVQTAGETEELLDLSEENMAVLREEAQQLDVESVMRYIRIFSELSAEMRYAPQKRVLLEIAVIRLCRPAMDETQDALVDRIAQLERRVEEGIVSEEALKQALKTGAGGKSAEFSTGAEEKKEQMSQILPDAIPEEVQEAVRAWPKIVQTLSPLMRPMVANVGLSLAGDHKLMLVFDDDMSYTGGTNEATSYAYMQDGDHKEQLEEAITRFLGKKVEVVLSKNESGRSFESGMVDIRKIIPMDIEIEE